MPVYVDRTLTTEEIRTRMDSDPAFLEECIVALYQLQTDDERATDATRHQNGVGFNGVDASFLSSVARQIIQGERIRPAGQRLSPRQRSVCARMTKKYAGQIVGLLVVGTRPPTWAERTIAGLTNPFDTSVPPGTMPGERPARPASAPKAYKADVYISGHRHHEWELATGDEAKAIALMRKHIAALQEHRSGTRVTFGPLEALYQ